MEASFGDRESMGTRAGTVVPAFPQACVFCGGPLLSFPRETAGAAAPDELLLSCRDCGLYRICDEFALLLRRDPVKRRAVSFFVHEAAAEGLLPCLCDGRQRFQEIASPLVRALQKCKWCRTKPPKRVSNRAFVHRDGLGLPCRAAEEWETFFAESVRQPESSGFTSRAHTGR